MEEQKIYVVGGMAFTDMEQAKQAQLEQKRIDILNEKLDYRDMESVAKVYEMACTNRTFQTPLGVAYMVRMHDWMLENGYEDKKDMYIVVSNESVSGAEDDGEALQKKLQDRDEIWSARLEEQKKKEKETHKKYIQSLMINALLALLVVILFVISQTGSNPTVLNYKTKIINQYTSWEKELSEREAAIEEKEAQLGISEQ